GSREILRRSHLHHWPLRHPHANAQRTRRLPLLRRMPARLHHAILFQQPQFHPSCSAKDRAPHHSPLTRRPQPRLRLAIPPHLQCPSHRRPNQGHHGVQRPSRVSLRFHAGVHPDLAQLLHSRISQRPRQQQRRTWPQSHGPPHGQRRFRHHARP